MFTWGSSSVGGLTDIQLYFVSIAVLAQLVWHGCLCYPGASVLGVQTAPSPLHPNAPCKEPTEFGVQAPQGLGEAEPQSAFPESPLMCGLKKTDKTGKTKSPLLCPVHSQGLRKN